MRFYAGGRLMKEWTDGLPTNPMKLYVNAWFPSWLGGREPRVDKFVYVDRIQYTQQ